MQKLVGHQSVDGLLNACMYCIAFSLLEHLHSLHCNVLLSRIITLSCRHELDITALTGCLEREEKARTEEAAEHATAAAALQKSIADLQVTMQLSLTGVVTYIHTGTMT